MSVRRPSGASWQDDLVSVPFHQFLSMLGTKDAVSEVIFRPNSMLEIISPSAARVTTSILGGLSTEWVVDRLLATGTKFTEGRVQPSTFARFASRAAVTLIPLAYLALLYFMMQNLMGGPSQAPVGRRRRTNKSSRTAVAWDSVAGIDEARREVMEVVDFMRNPERYQQLGAHCPRGILLSGPPGCGKTLLARAAAQEAGVSLISCSASDFVEVFVGRGAARIRELFRRAEKSAPCILFFDELDALAKSRSAGVACSEEREQTLNQLLTEMDGFDSHASDDEHPVRKGAPVVVMAATNRPEILDPALVRPGRFDRHVVVPLPDASGRLEILRVHVSTRGIPLEDPESLAPLAGPLSQGFCGADLANVVNEAALLAVRDDASKVGEGHLHLAAEKVRQTKVACWPLRHG